MTQPTLNELADALRASVDAEGAVPAGVAQELRTARGWSGRLMDVLEVLTHDAERMGYLVGGHSPDEVATWLSPWTESALSLPQIRLVVSCGGWDPEPFVVLARAGLLERFLLLPNGSRRRVQGELAGGWASDQLALASDDEVIERVRKVIDADQSADLSAAEQSRACDPSVAEPQKSQPEVDLDPGGR